MKKVALLTLILLFIAGIAYAKDYQVKKKAGEYDVEVSIDKNPPVVVNNNMTVVVRDAAGKYVTDAAVKVEYSMPAMPGMPAMNYKADTELKGNEYKAKINLSMSDSWNVGIRIAHAGKTATAKLTVDAK